MLHLTSLPGCPRVFSTTWPYVFFNLAASSRCVLQQKAESTRRYLSPNHEMQESVQVFKKIKRLMERIYLFVAAVETWSSKRVIAAMCAAPPGVASCWLKL